MTGQCQKECETMIKHFGRVTLRDVLAQWSDSHPYNPRFLASEVANTLRSLMPEAHPVDVRHAGVIHEGQAHLDTSLTVSYGALADYFDSACTGQPAKTVTTGDGPFPTSSISIQRHWLDSIVNEAMSRMAYVGAHAVPANQGARTAVVANDPAPATDRSHSLEPPSGSSPGYMKMRQAQLRKNGERSATEQLDAAHTRSQRTELEVIELHAQLAIRNSQISQLQEDIEQLRRGKSEAVRAKQEAEHDNIRMEEQLEQVMGFAECLRIDNPVSPPEMRLAYACWSELTQDGTCNPSAAGGRGVHRLVHAWLERNRHKLNKDETERLCAVVSWRKRGSGAIRSR